MGGEEFRIFFRFFWIFFLIFLISHNPRRLGEGDGHKMCSIKGEYPPTFYAIEKIGQILKNLHVGLIPFRCFCKMRISSNRKSIIYFFEILEFSGFLIYFVNLRSLLIFLFSEFGIFLIFQKNFNFFHL